MDQIVLSSLGVAAVAVLLIEAFGLPEKPEVARIPDEETERSLRQRSDTLDD